jgi:hypothetical protein
MKSDGFTPHPASRNVESSVVKAHFSHDFERTHDTRTFIRSSGVFDPQVTRANGFHKEVIFGCEFDQVLVFGLEDAKWMFGPAGDCAMPIDRKLTP